MFKVSYSEKTGLVIHSRGQVSRQRRLWEIRGTYQTPQGMQTFQVRTKNKCYLTEISDLIVEEIRLDERATGEVDDIKWTAVGR